MALQSAGPAKRPRRFLGCLRLLGAVALLAAVVWYAGPRALAAGVLRASLPVFAGAALCSLAANVVSAARWAVIARGLTLQAPTTTLVGIYLRGVSTNMLLPGATLSGDLLRSVQLTALGNSIGPAAVSVALDRLSGLWVLCLLSLAAMLGASFLGTGWAIGLVSQVYLVALALVLCFPLALRLPLFGDPAGRGLRARLTRLQQLLRQGRPALWQSLPLSLLVQLCSAATLWLCLGSLGSGLGYGAVAAAAAPIFVSAALPISVAGFGTREVAAVLVLGLLGVPADIAAGAALLYGICSVLQGVVASPLLLFKPQGTLASWQSGSDGPRP